MDEQKPGSWLSSRTNVTALIMGIVVLASIWGAKSIGALSQVQIDALVSLVMVVGVPAIVHFRNQARKVVTWWRS